MESYFQLFPWRLDLEQEPNPEAVPLNEVLSLDEIERKREKMAKIKAKIKTWFNHQRGGAGFTANPYTPWLARLCRPAEPAPKRISDYQYYMQHADFRDKVATQFQREYPDIGRGEALAARCKVARALFEAEPEEVKSRMREESMKEHEAMLEEWKEADEGLPSVDEEDREEARRRFAVTARPLLDALHAYTGYYLMLVAGRPVDGKFDVLSVHSGKTRTHGGEKEQDFTEWSPEGYQRVLNEFIRFITAADTEPAAAGAGSSGAPTEPTNAPGGPVITPMDLPPPPPPAAPAPPTSLKSAAGMSTSASASATDGLRPLRPEDEEEMPMTLIDAVTRRPVTPPPADATLATRMANLAILTMPLRESLEAMTPARKETRLEALEKTTWELQRENNEVRRDKALKAAQAGAGAANTPDPEQTSARKTSGAAKASSATKNGKKRGMARGEGESDTAEETSGDVSDEGVERTEAPTTRGRAKAQTQAQAQGAEAQTGAQRAEANVVSVEETPDAPIKRNGAKAAPKWAVDGKASLENGTEGWGGEWMKVTGLWWALEKSTQFASSGFSTNGRPTEIGHWVKCVRKGTPNIGDVGAFASSWQGWWKRINPKWRVAADGVLMQAEQGEWTELEKLGVNGFLSVLIALRWWKEVGGDADWAKSVADVTWVLER
ncbi:hypothetical protein C8F04DRAFT_1269332 [Mycena alexandri]|uniref:Uncharacterized protein n=1 Tax=Mycena alexandri TaxID=1745969 RepID=A0AAD6SD64_9AGAR|nr:hypothetical protein C8F04DRAFT_1269332 [Mycena alexandri]